MLVPILCFTCGSPIGDKEDLFRHMRAELVRAVLAQRGTTATQAQVDAGLQIDVGDILDKLLVKSYCCRAHLSTAMVYSDYY